MKGNTMKELEFKWRPRKWPTPPRDVWPTGGRGSIKWPYPDGPLDGI